MSNHNYKQYYNNKSTNNKTADVVTAQEVTIDEEIPVVVETIDPVIVTPEPAPAEPTTGVVVDCKKLNIRKAASKLADIVTVVPAGTKLVIDLNKSKPEWYSVCTAAGIEGYCMKGFVKI